MQEREMLELVENAEAGSSAARLALAQYFIEQKQYREAEKWADMLADTGEPRGCYLSILLHSLYLDARMGETLGSWDLIANESAIVMQRVNYLMDACNSSALQLNEEQKHTIDENMNKAMYMMAFAEFVKAEQPDYGNVVRILRKLNTSKANILRGMCCMELQDYATAYVNFKNAAEDRNYVRGDKSVLEEGLFCDAMNNLATIYRVGIANVVNPNLDQAVSILVMARDAVKDDDFKRALSDEMSHYQRKMFGGYRYV